MIVRALRPGDAKVIIEARRRGDEVDMGRFVYEIGSGEALSSGSLEAAIAAVSGLMNRYESPASSHDAAASFDGEASVQLHRTLGLDPVSAGAGDFWIWLAVAHFSDVVEWRHSSPGGANLRNYGIGNKWDNLLARLWYRAELCYDETADDPYWLARRGSIDFWESGLIRVRYSSCRALSRALARFQYPSATDRRGLLHPTRPDGIRQLYKRLRRLQATVAFECLDDDAAYALVQELSADLART
jgi:hypothetical protein